MNQISNPPKDQTTQDDDIDIAHYIDIVLENRWLIASIAAFFLAIGIGYVFLSKPVYEADIVIQVEGNQSSLQNLLTTTSDLLGQKTETAAEIEILRSRLVVAQAADNLNLNVAAQPKYFPIIGERIARRKKELSNPGFLGWGGYVWGNERIDVKKLEVPAALQAVPMTVTAGEGGGYRLEVPGLDDAYQGRVGAVETINTPMGPIQIEIKTVAAKPGAEFLVTGFSRLQTIEKLQSDLDITERGKQSGIIGAKLQGTDPVLTAAILNEIARQYVKQNVERKSAEAEKSLEFLGSQLPQLKKELEDSEDRYNALRNEKGTVNLDEEANLLLQQSVTLQTQLFSLQQRRKELLLRFTPQHPGVLALDGQIGAISKQLDALTGRVKMLPNLQQDVLRLMRDVKVNTELYSTLLNNVQQLKLMKAGRIGTVRLVDSAMISEVPVRPQRTLVISFALAVGLVMGLGCAFLRNALFSGVSTAQDIESRTGLTVYATVPFSETQRLVAARVAGGARDTGLLAQNTPNDAAIEAIRSLRTALQFAMIDAKNNIVLLTGAAPGVGKSFISSNLAAILAFANKRILLVDLDLRKGYLNQYFGYPRQGGASELFAGTMSVSEVVKKTSIEGLDFISTGALPPNPGELLLSPRIPKILNELSEAYDLVIVDTPPVLVAADTGILASLVATVFLIARANKTTIGELDESVKRLHQGGAHVTGVLFNGLNMSNVRYGGKYGRYRYTTYEYEAKF